MSEIASDPTEAVALRMAGIKLYGQLKDKSMPSTPETGCGRHAHEREGEYSPSRKSFAFPKAERREITDRKHIPFLSGKN